MYPSKSSIDNWSKLGNAGWDWNTLAPYYRKFQTYIPPTEASKASLGVNYIDDSIQGHAGPIKSSYPNFVGPLVKAWPETFKNLGWNVTGDPISGTSIGGFNGPYTVNSDGCVRSHAGNEYYGPAANRPNLHLLTEALVEKIVCKKVPVGGVDVSISATGISYKKDGHGFTAKARKEVILAAGVFQTPQILELSGIGSSQLLSKMGIDVLVDNPNIGENLQDHGMTGLCVEVKEEIPTADMRRDPDFLKTAKEMYEKERSGPLTAGFPSFAFMPLAGWVPGENESTISEMFDHYLGTDSNLSNRPSQEQQYALLRSMLQSSSEASIQHCLAASQVHFDKSTYSDVFSVTQPGHYLALLVSLPHPFSHGNIHIKSKSPTDLPLLDPKFMSHPLDPEIMGRHMMALEQIFATEPIASLIKPGGRRLPLGSDLSTLEKAKEHCRRNLRSTSHPCGTCAMLPEEKGGVVDTRLRVYGVKGLRIVDASVFPMVPRGNIQSSVYAVAERAADLIKEDWHLGSKPLVP